MQLVADGCDERNGTKGTDVREHNGEAADTRDLAAVLLACVRLVDEAEVECNGAAERSEE